MALKENYKDDILDTSQNVKRKYQMENNGDGTVSFTDVTEYTQQGDSFGSGAINPIAHAINGLNNYTFNPSGSIDLVALIADDSYHLNEDNKYVLADSTTGQALINSDPSTYKALASNTDLYGIEGEDTVSGFEPSCTPITVEGQTLSTIDDKLNWIIEQNHITIPSFECNAEMGSSAHGFCTLILYTQNCTNLLIERLLISESSGYVNIYNNDNSQTLYSKSGVNDLSNQSIDISSISTIKIVLGARVGTPTRLTNLIFS